MAGTASRCCRNTWQGKFNQSWPQGVSWSTGQSYLSTNRPWCQVSCKSDLFQSSSQKDFPFDPVVRSPPASARDMLWRSGSGRFHVPQSTWWATTIEPVYPRACDLQQEKSLEWKASALQWQRSHFSLQIEKSWAAMKTQCSQELKKEISPKETSEVTGEVGQEKGWNQHGSDYRESSEREAAACSHRELWNINCASKVPQPKARELGFHSPSSTNLSAFK